MSRLAIDTATAACSVALLRDDGAVFEHAPPPDRMFERPAHTTELLPAIGELLARADAGWDEIDAIAVGIGPGAFTGLRIGVTTARAIAAARDLPLAGVSSLAALAEGAADPAAARTVLPVIDAKRGELFYRAGGEDRVAPPAAVAELARELPGAIAVGDGALQIAEQLRAAGLTVPEAQDPRHLASAAAVARLAERVEARPAAEVVPNYIRPPDAQVSARERWLAGGVRG